MFSKPFRAYLFVQIQAGSPQLSIDASTILMHQGQGLETLPDILLFSRLCRILVRPNFCR